MILNLSPWPENFTLGSLCERARLRLTTYLDRDQMDCRERIEIRDDEGIILDIS